MTAEVLFSPASVTSSWRMAQAVTKQLVTQILLYMNQKESGMWLRRIYAYKQPKEDHNYIRLLSKLYKEVEPNRPIVVFPHL